MGGRRFCFPEGTERKMLATVLTGAMIAISFSAPPGPVAMETIRRGLRGGFSPALNVQLGSIIGDFMWFMLAMIGVGQLAQIVVIRGALAVVGVGLLLYLGACGIRDAFKSAKLEQGGTIDPKRGAFRSGMAISIANPMAIGYWLSIGGTLIAAGVAGQSGEQTALFVLGFVAGTFMWAFIMALAVRFGKQILHPNLFRVINFGCGAALMIFGIMLASQMLG
jgi:threonine/homoserine/homoserine lactone efflux protein